MKWLNNNWFKLLIGLCAIFYLFIQFMNMYVGIRQHNLEIVSGIRQCLNGDYSDEFTKKCGERILDQRVRIFKHLIY